MLVHCGLHQVVAGWAGLTVGPGPGPGPRVLPAPVTPPPLHLPPSTLTLAGQLVTLDTGAPPTVTVTCAAPGGGESEVVCHTDITPVARDARSALTPARPQVTGLTQGPYGVTVTRVTASAAVNIPVRLFTSVTSLPFHIPHADALPSLGVTLLLPSAGLVALTEDAAQAPVDRVPPVARPAQLASLPRSVVEALETRPRHRVTVAGSTHVNIPVALTLYARPGRAMEALRVPVIPVHTQLAPGPRPPSGTLGAHGGCTGQVAPAQPGGAVILGHAGARTRLTVIGRGSARVSVVTIGARVARVSTCVVSAVAHARVHMAVVRVSVTVAWNALAGPLVMEVSRLTRLTVPAFVAHRTLALLNPLGSLTPCSWLKQMLDELPIELQLYQSSFQLHSIDESLSRCCVGSPDPDRRQIAHDTHELCGGQPGPPAQTLMVV